MNGDPLTADERADLILMREEERMARDLYRRFHEAWDVPIFANIAASEQRHFDAVGRLLDRYGVSDPSVGQQVGHYSEPRLQEAYDTWLARGLSSAQEAYAVGVELETGDIADLTAAVEATDQDPMHRVYGNLLEASERHLQAFESAVAGRPIGGGRGWCRDGGGGGRRHRGGR